jgi:hypothetical protein
MGQRDYNGQRSPVFILRGGVVSEGGQAAHQGRGAAGYWKLFEPDQCEVVTNPMDNDKDRTDKK